MFVYVHVLAARGSIEGLGTSDGDKIDARLLHPALSLKKKILADRTLAVPVIGESIGLEIPAEVAGAMKSKLARRRKPRNKFLLELEIVRAGRPIVAGAVRLLCLAHGFVVERWVYVRRHEGASAIGAVKLRMVMRGNEEDVTTVLGLPEHNNTEPNDLTRTDGCTCDLCDPVFATRDETPDESEHGPPNCTMS